jgi:hypothetical protein
VSRLGGALDYRIDRARAERQWDAISDRLSRPPRRRARAIVTLGVAAGIAGLLGGGEVLRRRTIVASGSQGSATGDRIVAGPAGVPDLALPDGTRLTVGPRGRLRLAASARLRLVTLESGVITLDVAHDPMRPFEVTAGRVVVRVLGTRFTVALGAESGDVTVSVERGLVQVRRIDETVTAPAVELPSGATWSSRGLEPPQPAVDDGPAAPLIAPPQARPVTSNAGPASKTPRLKLVSTGPRRSPGRGSPAPPASPSRVVEARSEPSPRSLFALAEGALLAGDVRGAAAAFERFLRRYPADGRAALAAFELGKIRLDVLGDPGGALAAFTEAAARSSDERFVEHALARRVHALDRLDGGPRCRAARDEYLSRFSAGGQAGTVRGLCR